MKKIYGFVLCLLVICASLLVPSADTIAVTSTKRATISGNNTSGVVVDKATYYFDDSANPWSFSLVGYNGNANPNLNYLGVSVSVNKNTRTATISYTVTFTELSYYRVYGYGSNTWTATSTGLN